MGTSTAVAPIMYAGDPTVRGLAKMPTVFSPADAFQGVDDNVTRELMRGGEIISDFMRNASVSASLAITNPEYNNPGGNVQLPVDTRSGQTQTTIANPAPRVPTSLEDWREYFEIPGTRRGDVTQPDPASTNNGTSVDNTQDRGAHQCSDLTVTDFVAHPIDSANCLLDRFLFGILALVLIGFGIWIFAKD